MRSIEYQSLYQEIAENTKNIYIILQVYSVGITAIFTGIVTLASQFFSDLTKVSTAGSGVSTVHIATLHVFPFLFLAPVILAIPSIVFINSLLNSTTRIASYLRVFYDEDGGGGGIQWQKRLQQLRSLEKSNRKRKLRFFSNALLNLFNWTCSISIAASVIASAMVLTYSYSKGFRIFTSRNFSEGVVHVLILSYWVFLTILSLRFWLRMRELRRRFSSEYFDELTTEWRKIRLLENN